MWNHVFQVKEVLMMNALLMMATNGNHNKRLKMQANYIEFDRFNDHCIHPLIMAPKWNITQVTSSSRIQASV